MAVVPARQFLERLGKGRHRAVLLLGNDVFWRDQCRAQLVESYVPEGAREWAVARFSLAEVSVDPVLQRAQTLPMLAARQVVFVEEVEALEKKGDAAREAAIEQLTRYLDDPAPFTLLVFEASQLDQRRKLSKVLAEKALVVELDVGQEAATRITAELAGLLGVEIDRDAATLL